MLASELDFDLPPELIAQTPIEPRDAARMLVLRRDGGALEHRFVRDLPALLRPRDLLVFNDTRVLRARLFGRKPSGGRVEALLLKEHARNRWEALLKPSARLQTGGEVRFGNESSFVDARLIERRAGSWILEFSPPTGFVDVREMLPRIGEVPLPPYIREKSDEARYQTTFSRSKTEGNPLDSAAAPTAGLHFTPELLARLKEREIESVFVTLAVGAGTFAPVKSERLDDHPMHLEEFHISPEVANRINAQKAAGGRVIAVGTTSVRTLESAVNSRFVDETQRTDFVDKTKRSSFVDEANLVRAGDGETRLFLRPGAKFRVVDGLLTNFHLPRSTLLALVAAFVENGSSFDAQSSNGENGSNEAGDCSGLSRVQAAYREAISQRYRFFSFGDAMLVI